MSNGCRRSKWILLLFVRRGCFLRLLMLMHDAAVFIAAGQADNMLHAHRLRPHAPVPQQPRVFHRNDGADN
jgi:hypothetical protein